MPGHIQQVKKNGKPIPGYWRIIVEAGRDPITGKRHRIIKYCHGRKADAEALKEQIISELRQQTYVQPAKTTLGEWLDKWLNDYKKLDLRPVTWESYEYLIRMHIQPVLGIVRLQDLTTDQIQALYRQKVEQKLANSTVRRIHQIIHGALEQAVQNRMIPHNPSKGAKLPKIQYATPRALTPEEEAKFLTAIQTDRLGVAFLVLLGTGLRRGELLALSWRDIDLENGIIHVRQGVTFTKTNGLYVDRPKSEKSIRSIPLPKILVIALQGHKERMMLEGNYHLDGPVFCTTKGTRIIPRNFNRVFQRLCRTARIEDVNLHALRHTFATRLLEAGEALKVVQELLGHSKISITGDIYSHVSPEIMRRAADKMDAILNMGIKMESKQGSDNNSDP